MNIKFLKNTLAGSLLLAIISLALSTIYIPQAVASYTKTSTITPQQVNALGVPAAWNAATNTPTITSNVAYAPTNSLTVTTGGTINLNVNNCACSTVFAVGDMAYFDGTYWQQISSAGGGGSSNISISGTPVAGQLAGWATASQVQGVYGPTLLQQGVIDLVYAASGVFANSSAGALTLATALPNSLSQGFYGYFPASAVYTTQTAGWYWCVGSSSTAATCYNNQYYAASGTAATIPTSPVAFAGNGPGTSFANTLNAYVPFASVNIPANTLGVRGSITTLLEFNNNNSATAKICGITYGGTGTSSPSISQSNTTAIGYANSINMYNVGNLTYQKWGYGYSTSISSQYYSNVNSAAAQSMWISCELSTSGTSDYVMVQQYTITTQSAP